MPLESPDLQHLNAAEGFLTLGMYEDANAELEVIDPFFRSLPEVLEVRLEIYGRTQKWDLMQVVASKLAQHDPGKAQWVILLAYATRRAESIPAAKKILLDAVQAHQGEPIVHFNLACYDCQTGDLESAKEHLKRAFAIEPKCREMALDDPDLKPLWHAIANN
jgi:tetratricopeptide (TPR) repeat protein